MKYQFISLTVALLLSFVPLSAQTVFDVKGTVTDFTVSAAVVPDEVRFITLYTQIGKAGTLYPYVIRFEDEAGKPVYRKEAKKVLRCIKKQAVDSIRFEGFVLVSVGNMVDDAGARKAAEVVKSYGLHDYGKRDTPVYYFERQE